MIADKFELILCLSLPVSQLITSDPFFSMTDPYELVSGVIPHSNVVKLPAECSGRFSPSRVKLQMSKYTLSGKQIHTRETLYQEIYKLEKNMQQ